MTHLFWPPYTFPYKSENTQKTTFKDGAKNHIFQRGHDGEFFVSEPICLRKVLHLELNCYQKIPGSAIFMAEFTGLV